MHKVDLLPNRYWKAKKRNSITSSFKTRTQLPMIWTNWATEHGPLPCDPHNRILCALHWSRKILVFPMQTLSFLHFLSLQFLSSFHHRYRLVTGLLHRSFNMFTNPIYRSNWTNCVVKGCGKNNWSFNKWRRRRGRVVQFIHMYH